ncbi:hypothetical protein MKZ38_009063 [Zalerion maritima]|uniref:Uncharacterized protein n=1 Tax=Zalerion maritima TaxID=339359 RepID=A0AAD5WNC3_9PEZI|nr:hypothetical protein MKZ38_009063 [Zalerion maritima]
MISNLITLALAATPLVSAHGKVAVVNGDQGGNTTALGILGGIVPGEGSNDVTEIDTTVFNKKNIQTNGLGKTQKNGKNTIDMLSLATEQSGPVLPQVSGTNGTLTGVFHIVTSDGAGPLKAVLDPTATGKFGEYGVLLEVLTQVPGKGGNISPVDDKRWLREEQEEEEEPGSLRWAKRGEAVNINLDFPMAFKVPDNTQCQGTVDGVEGGVCLVKIANSNGNGPFGGVVAIQMVDESVATPTTAVGSGDATATDTPSTTLPDSVVVTSTGEASVKVHCEQVVGKIKRWWLGA